MCPRCRLPVTATNEDEEGGHKNGCPIIHETREQYLARRARTMPRLERLHDFMRDGGDPLDLLGRDDDEQEGA